MQLAGIRGLFVAAAAVAAFLLATGTTFEGMRESAGGLLGDRSSGTQGSAQISGTEFQNAYVGMTPETLRGLVGEPEATSEKRVEGLRIECWYYGVGAGVGAYQLCFADGKLRTKTRFGR